MKRAMRATSRKLAVGLLPLGLTAAVAPAVLSGMAGQWEVSGRPGEAPSRVCLANPMVLAQFEHRSGACDREVLRDSPASAEISYSCPGGEFGTTTIRQITPRSLRIETQGISGGAPFHYVLQARRIGNC
jgi:hypothetical protein